MTRIFLKKTQRNIYFRSLKTNSNLSWIALAKKLEITDRQLRDLRKGVYSLSSTLTQRAERLFGVFLPKDILIKSNLWYLQENARRGGLRRFNLYGSPGTPEGRKKVE